LCTQNSLKFAYTTCIAEAERKAENNVWNRRMWVSA